MDHEEVLEKFLPVVQGRVPDDLYRCAVMMLEVGEPESGALDLMGACEELGIPVPDDIISMLASRYLEIPSIMAHLEERSPNIAKRIEALEHVIFGN